MGLVCALGCALRELSNPNTPADPPITRITPKVDVGSEKTENQHLAGEADTKTETSHCHRPMIQRQRPVRSRDEPKRPTDNAARSAPTAHGVAAETKTENLEVPAPPLPPDGSNGNALFTAMTNLNDHLTMLRAALRSVLLLFSGTVSHVRRPRSPTQGGVQSELTGEPG
jgi:hypothetical protein